MNVLEIKYLNNSISAVELEYIKKHIPERFAFSLSYKSEESRNLTLLSGMLIYNNLHVDECSIQYNKLNKPYLNNDLFFNVSHSKDIVVFAKSNDKIGIDIETINEKNKNILDYAFNDKEKEYILNGKDNYSLIERLIKIWTIKESLFKASSSEKYLEPKNINAFVKMDTNCALEIFDNNDGHEMIANKDNRFLEVARISFLEEEYNVYSFKWLGYMVSVASKKIYDEIRIMKDKIIAD